MVYLHTQPSLSRAYPNRCYLESVHATEQVLEQHRNRTRKPNELRRTLVMTKCMCERIEDPLVMTRDLLSDTIRHNRYNQKIETLELVIDLLNKQKQLWFSQSLTAGTSTFWNNKVQTTDQLIKEIEGLK